MTTIRGAITIENNTAEEITGASELLIKEIIERNGILLDDIIYILFTATNDIDKAYPAVAARKLGLVDISLMCMQEMYVEGSLQKCIRVMVAINSEKTQKEMHHCYMKNAEALRPDIAAKQIYTVAIDGPTASGKSTVAKEVAKRLSIGYIDTGAMYRAVALHCMRKGINDIQGIIGELDKFLLTVKYEQGEQKIFLDGEDVTEAIRTQEVAGGASAVAEIPEVRQKLTTFQKNLAKNQSLVMDGRDIGTVVLPDSIVKIFINASLEERTKRRCIDLEKKGLPNNFETVKKQISDRDNNDSNRAASPLLKAEGATEIDTSEMTLPEVVDFIVKCVNEKLAVQK